MLSRQTNYLCGQAKCKYATHLNSKIKNPCDSFAFCEAIAKRLCRKLFLCPVCPHESLMSALSLFRVAANLVTSVTSSFIPSKLGL